MIRKEILEKRKVEMLSELSKHPMTWSEFRDRFAEKYKLSTPSISRILKELIDSGEITKDMSVDKKKVVYKINKWKINPEDVGRILKENFELLSDMDKAGLFKDGMSDKDVFDFIMKHREHRQFKLWVNDKINQPVDRMRFNLYMVFINTLSIVGATWFRNLNPPIKSKIKIEYDFENIRKFYKEDIKRIDQIAKEISDK